MRVFQRKGQGVPQVMGTSREEGLKKGAQQRYFFFGAKRTHSFSSPKEENRDSKSP